MHYVNITLNVGCPDQEIILDLLDFLDKASADSLLALCVQTGLGFGYNRETRDLPRRALEKLRFLAFITFFITWVL